MENPGRSRSVVLRLIALFASLSVMAALLSRCGGSDGNKGDAVAFQNVYSGSFDPQPGSALTASVVDFTLSWNEDGGKISGTYRDNHFASSSVVLSGSVQNGIRIFIINLSDAVDGVAKLTIATEAVDGELSGTLTIANLAGVSAEGSVLFEKNGIVMSKGDGALGVPHGDSGSSAFFADVAGDYDLFANNTNGKNLDVDWTHGSKYKVTISADGKIIIPTNDAAAPKVYEFSANSDNTYEKYDHEEYVAINGDGGLKVLVQRHFNNNKINVTWQITDGAFWVFQSEAPGAAPTVFADDQVEFIVGTHAYKITSVGGDNPVDYKKDDPVSVTVTADGKVSGTFGEFVFVPDDSLVVTYVMNGKNIADVTFFRPDRKTFPQWHLALSFENDVFKRVVATYQTQPTGEVGRKYYTADVDK